MLRKPISRTGLAGLWLGLWLGLSLPAQLPPSRKLIDIGAADAPLSDDERTALATAIAKHDYAAEKTVIDKALNEHPQSREILLMAGRVAYLEKQPKDAVQALEKADKIKPLEEEDRVTLALVDQFTGRNAQAREQMAMLMKGAPKNAQYAYLMGRLETLDRHLEAALTNYRKAIELDPTLLRAYQDLGHVQEGLGKNDEARKTYELAVAQNRRQKTPWEWPPADLGILILNEDKLSEAEKLFQEALRYNPRFGWAYYYLGRIDQRRANHSEAIEQYRLAVIHEPALRQAWLALGHEYSLVGQQAEADKCLAVEHKLEEQENARKTKRQGVPNSPTEPVPQV